MRQYNKKKKYEEENLEAKENLCAIKAFQGSEIKRTQLWVIDQDCIHKKRKEENKYLKLGFPFC